jgi:hypothetical protein
MFVWMCALVSGAWWVWPHIQRAQLTTELVVSLMWLIIGAAAWVMALNIGWERYRRR